MIAYLLPGFTVLWGLSHLSKTVGQWFTTTTESAPTIGGFLFITIASVGLGLTVSTLRWAILDLIHHRTGIPVPPDDFSNLDETLPAYQYIVGSHYDYYKFYSNEGLALLITYLILLFGHVNLNWWSLILLVVVEVIFWMGARDTLRKYHTQGKMLLNRLRNEPSDIDSMNQ